LRILTVALFRLVSILVSTLRLCRFSHTIAQGMRLGGCFSATAARTDSLCVDRPRGIAIDNEEHSIGGARPQKNPRSGKDLGRALPIEFVELSRTESYGY